MKKRLLTLLLAVSCVVLTACGGGDNGGNAGNNNSDKENNAADEASYVFTYDGMEISVNEDIESVVSKLGEPVAYYEAASCAFDGMDKFYTYSSFQLDTYPKDGKDMLASIYFKDDLVKTTEGISLYMSKDDMLKAYGEATTVNGNEYTYEKGNGCLYFIVENDEIVSIEYQTKVDYN
ncbi:MAG: hypothetical protein IJA07_01620 [Agathobacter sp.]|nr:hypothetical protein [Agathobacter sp.]MBQ3558196.1 hypothetical protein [Agathobacter sp.]